MTVRTITRPISKGWNSTRGYKTTFATAVWLIIRAIDLISPGALSPDTQMLILDIASFIGILGLGDKLWIFLDKRLNFGDRLGRWIEKKFNKKE